MYKIKNILKLILFMLIFLWFVSIYFNIYVLYTITDRLEYNVEQNTNRGIEAIDGCLKCHDHTIFKAPERSEEEKLREL